MAEGKKLIAANWKMSPAPADLQAFKSTKDVDAVVFPTFLDIPLCLDARLTVGAQYGHPEDSGAHTGDISMKMVKDLGCSYVLCGHSERRKDHGETNEFVAMQVISALKHGLHPILCVGETWEERKAGKSKDVVKTQLEAVLRLLTTNYSLLTIAYEPVWAISGGDASKPAASAADAEDMHSFIRNLLATGYRPIANCQILYGGSMKPENAEELLKQPNIDGGLVGGASLDPEKFRKIVRLAEQCS
jgi:triosephosphate isomerase